MEREVFFYELGVYMLNKASKIKKADKKIRKLWISFIQQYVDSEYLHASYKKWYPNISEIDGVHYDLVWDDIRKTNLQHAIFILSDIEEVMFDLNENDDEKVMIFLMNKFAKVQSNEFNTLQ